MRRIHFADYVPKQAACYSFQPVRSTLEILLSKGCRYQVLACELHGISS